MKIDPRIELNSTMSIIGIEKKSCDDYEFGRIVVTFPNGTGVSKMTRHDVTHAHSYNNMIGIHNRDIIHFEYHIKKSTRDDKIYTAVMLCFYEPFEYLKLDIIVCNYNGNTDDQILGDCCNKIAAINFEDTLKKIEQQLLFVLL